VVQSPVITLAPGTEPTDATETGPTGGMQDTVDENGDMTIDFGFIPLMSIGSNCRRNSRINRRCNRHGNSNYYD